MVGATLSHYRILEKIGSGGMGDVYLAEDTKLSRNVALKVLPADVASNQERYISPTEDGMREYSLSRGKTRPLTDLTGRPGKMGTYALATDGRYLYFVWRLDESDIWVMDVE